MSLLRDYAASLAAPPLSLIPGAPATRYDEVIDAGGILRPPWRAMAAVALGLTEGDFRRVDEEISGLLADDGVTYENPDFGTQPWRLDPMPLVLDAATWSGLEAGLAQRAELLGAMLVDLYGERTLLSERIIPAAAVMAHGGYVRPAYSSGKPDPHPLILSGADLGRSASGEWHVIADRVQAPSGLGYAMENRRVISRVLPELYDDAGLHRVEPYFTALRSALVHAAPAGIEDPRVVVLTPGTKSETAYDQAFLASVLGFPLVRGSDLIVRDGAVWMRPAGFPDSAPVERIDVILRRVDALWCDPLELRGNSQLGVAGLSEVVRRGRVRLVNGLGAGVLENPGLMPFLPAVCEHLLGEQLRLPSVPTWWCGEAEARERVLDSIASGDDLIVRTLDGSSAEFAGVDRVALRQLILDAPHRFVGQERLPLSQAPAWNEGGKAAPGALTLRTFTIRDGVAYRPLVGGLATVVDAAGAAPLTKDVWVLKSAPTEPDQGLQVAAPIEVARAIPALAPGALADMFWSGRYAERAEALVRLVITTHAHAEELDHPTMSTGIATAEALHGSLARLCPRRFSDSSEELRSLIVDSGRPGSAANSLMHLRGSLESVRDQLSVDTWRALGISERAVKSLRTSTVGHRVPEYGGRVLSGILSLHGVTQSMVRDAGWRMIEVGRFLERAQQVVMLLAATAVTRHDAVTERAVLEGVLMATESSVTHRRRHRGDVRTAGVLDLLLGDADNPRSVAFALARVREHLAALPGPTGATRPERLLETLEDAVIGADALLLAAVPLGGMRRDGLADFLAELLAQLRTLADAVGVVHFESGPLAQPIFSLALTELVGAEFADVSLGEEADAEPGDVPEGDMR